MKRAQPINQPTDLIGRHTFCLFFLIEIFFWGSHLKYLNKYWVSNGINYCSLIMISISFQIIVIFPHNCPALMYYPAPLWPGRAHQKEQHNAQWFFEGFYHFIANRLCYYRMFFFLYNTAKYFLTLKHLAHICIDCDYWHFNPFQWRKSKPRSPHHFFFI